VTVRRSTSITCGRSRSKVGGAADKHTLSGKVAAGGSTVLGTDLSAEEVGKALDSIAKGENIRPSDRLIVSIRRGPESKGSGSSFGQREHEVGRFQPESPSR